MFWFVAALDAFYRADTLIWSIVWGALSIFMMITATRRPDTPTASFMIFRMLAVTLLGFDLVKGAVTGEWAGAEFWIFVLIAEYAATIRIVPPRETEKRAVKVGAAK